MQSFLITQTRPHFTSLTKKIKTNPTLHTDIQKSKSKKLIPISKVSAHIGLLHHEVQMYGEYKAKVSLDVLDRLRGGLDGCYVVVTAVNPTVYGEGKTVTTVGLSQALGAHLGRNVFANIRQSSMGPTFGRKGGAAGGGYAQVIPLEAINLEFTGDFHAVSQANNLLLAQVDTRILHEMNLSTKRLYELLCPKDKSTSVWITKRMEKLGFKGDISELSEEQLEKVVRLNVDPLTINLNRVVDVNDRLLRNTQIGISDKFSREARYSITAASELMAILSQSKSLSDIMKRISDIVVAFDTDGHPLTPDDFGVTGAMMILMRETLKPNLLQTLEGTPAFVHSGPFANIAHGVSSIVADQIALKLVGPKGFVLTEGGFGADMGLEKFVNIKCRNSGLIPKIAVIVATVKALKHHGETDISAKGDSSLQGIRKGSLNLKRHIENTLAFGLRPVVAVNKFTDDTDDEIELIRELSLQYGASAAHVSDCWTSGGSGVVSLAEEIVKIAATTETPSLNFTYNLEDSIPTKIEKIIKNIYRGKGYTLSPKAASKIDQFTKSGYSNLPICMAKTPYSFSHDPALVGSPDDFEIPISDLTLHSGAGFITVLLGKIMLMPGLPVRPAIYDMDFDTETGEITGLD